MALFCLIVGGVVGAISFSLFQWEPATATESMVQKLALEGLLTLTVFSLLGAIWALFAPRWLTRLVQTAYAKLLMTVGVLLLVFVCLLIHFGVAK